MRNLRSYTGNINAIAIAAILLFIGAVDFASYGQKKAVAPRPVADKYSMSPDSRYKPELRHILVRLKGDRGVSIVDLITGEVVSHNFAPVTNSQGTVRSTNWTTPVIGDIFCMRREKEVNGERHRSMTVYRDASHPVPVAGLTDLYSANIINPNLFPISRRGERIKFVDNKGNVKFTVMPIDGKEPRSVRPIVIDGLIIVEVNYGGERVEHTTSDGRKIKLLSNSTTKQGAVDTTGKWVIYPEWDTLESYQAGVLTGWKDGVRYTITPTGKAARDVDQGMSYEYSSFSKYLIEPLIENGRHISNIYDLKQDYITTLDNADYIRPNHIYPNILLVRRDFYAGGDTHDNLVDLSNNNAVVSKNYKDMTELPDGNYLAENRIKGSDAHKCLYVKTDGTETSLPDNCEYPLRHSLMALFYEPAIDRLIVVGQDGAPGYICDFNGNKVGDLLIEEFYNTQWEAEPVKSSYWRKHIHGED